MACPNQASKYTTSKTSREQPCNTKTFPQGATLASRVSLKQPISLNHPYTFIVYASVSDLIYQDNTNPGNVGIQFYPSTFQSASGTEDLRVEFELPPNVPQDAVRSPQNLQFDNVFVDENRTAVFWERTAWVPGDPFLAGVSFPQQYVTGTPLPTFTLPSISINPFPTPNQGGFPSELATVAGIAFVVIAIIVIAALSGAAKSAYESPRLSVEALGANRSLTAVEAGLVLGLKPVRVITMMLYGLLLKHQVVVTESEPILKLKKLEKTPTATANDTPAPQTASPRYYEIDFLNAIKPDGTLDETALANAYRGLVNTVNQKLSGYSRQDTENYYRSIVDKAWAQVTQAGTPDLMGDAFDKNLEWLLADHNFDDNMHTAFPAGIIILPNPAWWWYWSGPHFPNGPQPTNQTSQPSGPTMPTGAGTPTPRPSPTTPAPMAPKPVAGQDFANNIVRGLQGASNNIVKDVQGFANKLVPFAPSAPKGEGSVAGKPSCVCACHSCACHCACVSCACACAGGGAH